MAGSRLCRLLPGAILTLVAGTALVVAGTACGGDDEEPAPTSSTEPSPAADATSEPLRILSVNLAGSTRSHGSEGDCPLVTADIEVSGPGSVSYIWTRSDGAEGTAEEITFPAAGSKSIEEEWVFTAPLDGETTWIGLRTVSPEEKDWGKVDVQPCAGGTPTPSPTPEPTVALSDAFSVVNVVLTAATWSDDYYKKCPVVTAEIETDGPGTVTYKWTRSDGAGGLRQTLEFTAAGKQTIEERWNLSSAAGEGTYWIGLLIEGPAEKDWGHAEVRRCESP